MPSSEFFDYEPVRRPQKKRVSEPEPFPRRVAEPPKDEFFPTYEPEPVRPVRKVELRRGHALSFAGLFLFLLVLYIRPYEFFPSALWMRSMAFWIAMLTLAVYVPTQLGLDGKLTVWTREAKLVLLLLLFALLSIPQALDSQLAWNGFVDYLKVVLMFIVLINVVRTEGRLRVLLLLVLLVSCVLSIGAIHDYMGGKLDLGGKRIKGVIGGMFDNPNDLALHLVTMIPIALGLLFTSRAFLKKLFYGSAAILMTAGVVVTFSRGGFLALICMGTLLAWRIGRRNKWLILLVVPIILVTFIVLAPGGYGNRLATTSDESALARLDDLKRSIFITLHHPVMGVGMENYILFSNSNHATHNSFTQVSSELGLAALLVYLLFQIAPLRGLAKITRETSDSRRQSHYYYLSVGLAASIIGYMVASFFASVAFLWYVYFLVGYAVCLRRLYEASDEHVL